MVVESMPEGTREVLCTAPGVPSMNAWRLVAEANTPATCTHFPRGTRYGPVAVLAALPAPVVTSIRLALDTPRKLTWKQSRFAAETLFLTSNSVPLARLRF